MTFVSYRCFSEKSEIGEVKGSLSPVPRMSQNRVLIKERKITLIGQVLVLA